MRSPHAHARIVDIDVTAALEVDGLVAIYTYDDLDGRAAEPLPLLIPHPTLTHGRTPYALAKDEVNHVGEAIVMVVADDRYVAEDAAALDRGRLRLPAAGGRHRAPRGRPSAGARRRAGNVAAVDGAGDRRRGRGHRRRTASPDV